MPRARVRKTITLPATDWAEFGREAFAAGLPRLALSDGRVNDAITGLPVGAGAADIMRGWYAGWDAANLAAPVEVS